MNGYSMAQPVIGRTTHFINGCWSESGGPTFANLNPLNDEVIAQIAAGGRAEAEAAVSAAAAAFPAWAAMPPGERQRLFLKAADITERRLEDIVPIMAVEGVDGCWIGPKDLARSMAVDVNTPAGAQAHEAAILQVLAACRATGKIAGIDGGAEANGRHWIEHGFQFVSVTNDSWLLSNGGQMMVERLRRPA